MKKTDFLIQLQDILQRDDICNENDNLKDYDEWDSLSKMALIAYFSKTFNINLSLNTLKEVQTVKDIINLAGGNIE